MTSATSLYDVAHELLVKSAAILGADAPTHQYVSHGPPAYDCCDTLTVHAGILAHQALRREAPGASPAGQRDPRIPVVPIVPLTVTTLSCQSAQPSGGLAIKNPPIAKIIVDAQTVYAHGWVLFNGLYHAYKAGSLFAGYPCRVSEIDAAVPIAPEGGCLGWSVLVSVELDGFAP